MNRANTPGERSLALFLLGMVLFSPPLLSIFGSGPAVGGIPLLYLYLYGAWGLLIALLGISAAPRRDTARRTRQTGTRGPTSGEG